jgi:hypothetical protein
VDFAAIVFAHARPATLNEALGQVLLGLPTFGLATTALIVTDRCTPAVQDVVDNWMASGRVAAIMPAPVPLRSAAEGEQFNIARAAGLRLLDWLGIETVWAGFWDDDWLLQNPRAFVSDLKIQGVDYWDAAVLFEWAPGYVNVRRHHHSPLAFRYRPGQRMHSRWHTHVPEELREVGTHETLRSYVLDRGAVTPAERVALYRECARAGKCDQFTQMLVQPPHLMPLEQVLTMWPLPTDFVAWQMRNQ